MRIDKGYSRKKMIVLELMQVQGYKPDPKNEFNVKNAFFAQKTR